MLVSEKNEMKEEEVEEMIEQIIESSDLTLLKKRELDKAIVTNVFKKLVLLQVAIVENRNKK